MGDPRRDVLEQINATWERLTQALARVPAARIEEPGTLGGWSVKDLLGHVSTWEVESILALRSLLRGEGPPSCPSVDDFNAREVERKRGLPLERVREELVQTHQALLLSLEHLPAELLAEGSPGRRRVAADTYEHYTEHLADLERWLHSANGRS